MKKVNFIKQSAAALVIAVVALTGCKKDKDGGNIVANVRAYNNNGVAPASKSLAMTRSAGGGAVFAAGVAENGFETYNAFYDNANIGNPVGEGITPTKFVMGLREISVYTPTGESMSFGGGLYDFANDVSISVGEIPTDVTCALMDIWLNYMGTDSGPGYVEFAWPGGKTAFDAQKEQSKVFYESSIPVTEYMPVGFTPSWNGDAITMLFHNVIPDQQLKNGLQLSGTAPNTLFNIYYGKAPRRFYNSPGVPVNTLIEGLNSTFYGTTEMGAEGASIVIPFTPFSVPAEATSVTFNLSWNMEGIIQQYDNNTPGDVTDDIFVLKNGWWDDLYMNVSVQ